MASGRVGGTRSRKAGQIGDVIYQIVKNPDGSYSQVVYGKPEQVTQVITTKLQAQRMVTCMVEAMMRDLKPVGRISWQAGVNKSKSLNAFSCYNLQLVARDSKANWYQGNQFLYPQRFMRDSSVEKLGGPYMISAGTGQFDVFDDCVLLLEPWRTWESAQYFGKRFAGMRFDINKSGNTIGSFMEKHRMTRLDSVVFCVFHKWHEWNADEESYDDYTTNSYIIATINPSIPDGAALNEDSLKALFLMESDFDPFAKVSDDGQFFYMGIMVDFDGLDDNIYFYNAFTISYADGKKKITTKYMKSAEGADEFYLLGHAPADVFGTWMGETTVKPYPSPFV